MKRDQESVSATSGGRAAWLMALRPRTLWAAVAPVMVGLAISFRHSGVNSTIAIATVVDALLIQVATNLANDYYDFVKGADNDDRLGPKRVTQSGLIAASTVRNAAFAVLASAALLGIYLVVVGGWPIALIGVAGLVCAIAYTAGPFPLAYLGLGDVFVFAFFGVAAVSGTVWLQLGHLPAEVWPAALAVGAPATAILVANNLRDIAGDTLAGKKTLAVRFGAKFARFEYASCIALALLAVVWLSFGSAAYCALALVLAPWAFALTKRTLTANGAALNLSLAETAKFELGLACALSAGLALSPL